MPKNLQKIGDTYHALLMVPKDVRPIIGRSKFTRSTKHKSLKNAQITAAPWIAEWWQLIEEARQSPDAALERMAKLMALKKEQEEYVHVEHGIDKDGCHLSAGVRTRRSGGYFWHCDLGLRR